MTKEHATESARKWATDYGIECVVVEDWSTADSDGPYQACSLEVMPRLFPKGNIVTHVDANGATAEAH
jgi:hypothetical protein